MAGANANSLVGSGYVVANVREPLITVVFHGTEFHVCQRPKRTEKYKTIVACFLARSHADTFAAWLTIDAAQPQPQAPRPAPLPRTRPHGWLASRPKVPKAARAS